MGATLLLGLWILIVGAIIGWLDLTDDLSEWIRSKFTTKS